MESSRLHPSLRGSLALLLPALPLLLMPALSQAEALPNALEVDQIAPGIYLRPGVQEVADARNHGHIANLGFIVGDERVAVIDAGGSRAEGEALLSAVRQVTALPVSYLILTHMHPDHVLGSGVFADAGAQVIGHANLADALVRRQDFYVEGALEYLGAQAEGSRIAMPTVGVAAGESLELDLGGRVLELRGYPTAHTNNDLSVLDRTTGLLWLSDLLFVERIPVIDGSLLGWLGVIEQLSALQVASVVPGHGPYGGDWKAALAKQRVYLEAVADGVREQLRTGADLSSAVRSVAMDQRDDWLLFDDYHGRNVTAAYVELEWE
jgi:quinoprotein relay system zinc metallohydrolase 2